MTLPTWIASGTIAATATTAATFTPAPPNGAIGDLLILVIERQDGTAAPDLSGSGWTKITNATAVSGTAHSVSTYWKVATSATGTVDQTAITFGSSTVLRAGRVFRFRNTSLLAPIHLSTINMVVSTATTVNATNLTSTRNNTTGVFIAAMIGQRSTTNTTTNWPATTGVTAFASTNDTTGNDSTFGIGVKQFATAGSYLTPGIVWSTNTTTGPGAGILLALNEEFQPNVPTSSAATGITSSGLTANWSAPATDSTHDAADGYVLEISTSATFSTHTVTGYTTTYSQYGNVVGLDVGNVTSKAVTGLTFGTTYYYRITPYNAFGAGTASGSQSPATTSQRLRVSYVTLTVPNATPVKFTGSQPNATGTLTRAWNTHAAGLTGSEPNATGVEHAVKPPVGSEPNATGTLTRIWNAHATGLTGSEPYSTGSLTRIWNAKRSTLTGSEPYPTGVEHATKPVTGSEPAPTGILTRIRNAHAAVTGSEPAPTGNLQLPHSVAGSEPNGTGVVTRTWNAHTSVVGSEPNPTGIVSRIRNTSRIVTGSQPAPTGIVTRIWNTGAPPATGSEPNATGLLARTHNVASALTGSQPYPTGVLNGVKGTFRTLTGSEPYPTGTASRIWQAIRSALTGSEPAASGTLTRHWSTTRTAAGSEPYPTGAISHVFHTVQSLAGSEPPANGNLLHGGSTTRAVAGSEPYSTGTLVRGLLGAYRVLAGSEPYASGIEHATKTMLGSQPSPTGALSFVLNTSRSVAGNQPESNGSVSRTWHTSKILTGSELAASGILARAKAWLSTLTGSQPGASGDVEALTGLHHFAGDQPAPTGILGVVHTQRRVLDGSEPAPAGRALRVWAITGVQPAASGSLRAHHVGRLLWSERYVRSWSGGHTLQRTWAGRHFRGWSAKVSKE